MIKGLIFDFDGMIIDTEMPEYLAWQEIYRAHGKEMPMNEWEKTVGSSRLAFDPVDYLETLTGKSFNHAEIDRLQGELSYRLIIQQPVLPGVLDYLTRAKVMNLKLAIASSSDNNWVQKNLDRVGLTHHFDCILTGDDVENVKPDPALYLEALNRLHIRPSEAIVFEDAPKGITAARAAGIYCVAVPNPLTRQLIVNHADLILNSLEDLSLEELISRLQNGDIRR